MRKQTNEKQGSEWLTAPEAARRLGIARPTVLQKALLGELRYKTFAGDVYIAAASVDEQRASASP